MSFFNFDYDPNNPRVGDRVIVVGDERLNQTAEENERFIPWFTQHRGGEFYIRKIVAGSIYLSSPLTNSIDNYTWSPNWLAPAPMRLERLEHVRVALTARDDRYTSFPSWTQEMEEYVGLMLVTATETAHNGCIRLSGARRVLDWLWNREWMYIVPDLEAATSVVFSRRNEQSAKFKEGDLVLVKGNISNSIVNGKGIIRCVSPSQPIIYRIEMYGKIQNVIEDRLILIERDGQHVFEQNSIEAKDLVF